MNITIPGMEGFAGMTAQTCQEWCIQQHFTHEYWHLWLFIIAVISLSIGLLIESAIKNNILKPENDLERHKYQYMFFRFSLVIMMTGFGLFLYASQ